MIRFDPTADQRVRAHRRAQTTPVYRGSHRAEAANEVGALGEILVEDWLTGVGLRIVHAYATTHDLEFSDGSRIEIKTKDRTVRPRFDYEASIPLYNSDHQQPDFFVFVSLRRARDSTSTVDAFDAGWIVGASSTRKLREHGKIWRAGEVDPSNGTRFWTDCLNVPISKLVPPAVAVAYWKKLVGP